MARQLTDGRWEWADHLDLLSVRLVDAAYGRCPRLFVTMPPQNGKSSLTSHWFPVWYLNRWPDRRIVFVSYAAEYAETWGRAVRNSIAEHATDLRVRLSPDSKAANEWTTTAGGGMVSVGVGGAVTGRRANLLIFDDPFKNAEEANSEAHRRKVWEFFQSAAYTRLTPDGVIVVIMTRWHEDDLVGRLKANQKKGGEAWESVDLPALAKEADPMGRKPGEPLWPGRWPLSALARIKKAVGSYFWSALYDQNPTPSEGNYFKRSWFGVVPRDRVPRLEKSVRTWDLAATTEDESDDPDWLAGLRMGRTADRRYYIENVGRYRESPDGVERLIKQAGMTDGRDVPIRIEQEGAASGKIVKRMYERMMDGWDCRFTGIPRSGKLARAAPFAAACERGDVFLVEGDWNDDFLNELKQFPHGNHDDQVDAASAAYKELTKDDEPWEESGLRETMDGRGESLDGDDGEEREPLTIHERLLRRARGESGDDLDGAERI